MSARERATGPLRLALVLVLVPEPDGEGGPDEAGREGGAEGRLRIWSLGVGERAWGGGRRVEAEEEEGRIE